MELRKVLKRRHTGSGQGYQVQMIWSTCALIPVLVGGSRGYMHSGLFSSLSLSHMTLI